MKKGDLWIIEFPTRKGREQSGKRPSIIMADTNTNLVLVIPLTSNLEALEKFPYTIEIKKSDLNKLEKDSVALVFQLQAVDKKRLHNKFGKIEDFYLDNVDIKLKHIFGLK